MNIMSFLNTKLLHDLLFLFGEDFKAAVGEHLVEHFKKWNVHPRRKKHLQSLYRTERNLTTNTEGFTFILE